MIHGATMAEEWRRICDHEGYEVSDLGNVRSYRTSSGKCSRMGTTSRPMHANCLGIGRYMYVMLSKPRRSRSVHDLVATAFHGAKPMGMECRHLDGDPTNNSATNLCWGTKKQNGEDKARHGSSKGIKCAHAKLNDDQVRAVRHALEAGATMMHLARAFGVSRTVLYRIKKGQTWTHVQ